MAFAGWHAGKFFGRRSRPSPGKVTTTLPEQPPPSAALAPPDLIRAATEVATKAQRTLRLLKHLAARDSTLDPLHLSATVENIFKRVQHCWQLRDYSSVKDQLMPVLLAEHEDQLKEMRKNQEINRIDNLTIKRLEFVHFLARREQLHWFTALITFQAKVYFVHERTGAFLRGAAQDMAYQEFWTFQRSGDSWRLLRIAPSSNPEPLMAANCVAGMDQGELEKIEEGDGVLL
jgi:predicted lipid-binding transport protein (Tim44 family)